jgi:hypothetical protein
MTQRSPLIGDQRENDQMRSMPRALTRRSKVLGLPVGRRRTDWAKIGRLSAAGLSTLSTVADVVDGFRASRNARAPEDEVEAEGGDAGDQAT